MIYPDTQDVQRLDSILREAYEIIDGRPGYDIPKPDTYPRLISFSGFNYSTKSFEIWAKSFNWWYSTYNPFKYTNNFNQVIKVDKKDLDYLIQEEAVQIKTEKELKEEFGITLEEFAPIYEEYLLSLRKIFELKDKIDYYLSKEEEENVEDGLSLFRILLNLFSKKRRQARSQRRIDLKEKISLSEEFEPIFNQIKKNFLKYRFEDLGQFVDTDQGVYIMPYVNSLSNPTIIESFLCSIGGILGVNDYERPSVEYKLLGGFDEQRDDKIELRSLDIPFKFFGELNEEQFKKILKEFIVDHMKHEFSPAYGTNFPLCNRRGFRKIDKYFIGKLDFSSLTVNNVKYSIRANIQRLESNVKKEEVGTIEVCYYPGNKFNEYESRVGLIRTTHNVNCTFRLQFKKKGKN